MAELASLAAPSDVLVALGFPSDSDVEAVLPVTMQVRMKPTLAKVSRRFRKEAQRIFTPGTYTHRLLIHCGATRLMEAPKEVKSVVVVGRDVVPDWEVDGAWLYWTDVDYYRLNGEIVDVTYTWETPVPSDVVTTVAEIAARNLVVDPMGAQRQSKQLQSRHFRQEMADWVSSGATGFTQDDIDQARSYRYPAPPPIIARVTLNPGPSLYYSAGTSW